MTIHRRDLTSVDAVFGGERSRLNTVVYHGDGKVFDLYDYGVVTRDFIVSSPNYTRDYIHVEGRHGVVGEDVRAEPRDISIDFWLQAPDHLEGFVDLRDFVFSIFGTKEEVYVVDTRRPDKRWKVVPDGPYQIEQHRMYGLFTVLLVAMEGVSESVNIAERTFDETEFVFKNEGNVELDLRNREVVEVEFRGVSSGLTIENLSNGHVWEYEGSTNSSDVILLKGVSSFKNGSSIFSDTNRRILSFEPGANRIKVSGTTGEIEVVIRTRWIFL